MSGIAGAGNRQIAAPVAPERATTIATGSVCRRADGHTIPVVEPKSRTSKADIPAAGTSAPDIPTPRAAQARLLRDRGMTVKAVGQALGVGERQVRRLLASAPAPPVPEPPAPEAQPAANPETEAHEGTGSLRRPRSRRGRSGSKLPPVATMRMISLDPDTGRVIGGGDAQLGPSDPLGTVDEFGRWKTGGFTMLLPRRSALDDHIEKKERAEREAAEAALLQEAIDAAPEGTAEVQVIYE